MKLRDSDSGNGEHRGGDMWPAQLALMTVILDGSHREGTQNSEVGVWSLCVFAGD